MLKRYIDQRGEANNPHIGSVSRFVISVMNGTYSYLLIIDGKWHCISVHP